MHQKGHHHHHADFERVIWIVLDGVGAGALPDAAKYGDEGANTLGHLAKTLKDQYHHLLQIPNLKSLGIGKITAMEGISDGSCGPLHRTGVAAYGRSREKSAGKDTSSGHWELAGVPVEQPFATYPNGFPHEIVDRWVKENGLPGVLGNKAASGTEILEELGAEHVRTGKPILYTSADSVWQVAAHEEAFGLDRLYKICKSARKICDELQIGRVIARPFIGDEKQGFKRTYHRKDLSFEPLAPTYLDGLTHRHIMTTGIGKISSIYADKGIQKSIETAGNTDGIRKILEQISVGTKGLIFCNLIDFDMLYGHRRDVQGLGRALEEFDRAIPELMDVMTPKDLLVLVADHGNDATHPGTDHTREYIPILAYSPVRTAAQPLDLGTRDTFADVGATIFHALTGEEVGTGKSFLHEILGK